MVSVLPNKESESIMSSLILEVTVPRSLPVRFLRNGRDMPSAAIALFDIVFPRYNLCAGIPGMGSLIFNLDHSNWTLYRGTPTCHDCVVWVDLCKDGGIEVGYIYEAYTESTRAENCRDIHGKYDYSEMVKLIDKMFAKEFNDSDD